MAVQLPSSPVNDASFETIFRWNSSWTSIHVKPVLKQPGFVHFKVTMLDGSHLFLWKNNEGGWEEWLGSSDRAASLGVAIDTHYLCK